MPETEYAYPVYENDVLAQLGRSLVLHPDPDGRYAVGRLVRLGDRVYRVIARNDGTGNLYCTETT